MIAGVSVPCVFGNSEDIYDGCSMQMPKYRSLCISIATTIGPQKWNIYSDISSLNDLSIKINQESWMVWKEFKMYVTITSSFDRLIFWEWWLSTSCGWPHFTLFQTIIDFDLDSRSWNAWGFRININRHPCQAVSLPHLVTWNQYIAMTSWLQANETSIL